MAGSSFHSDVEKEAGLVEKEQSNEHERERDACEASVPPFSEPILPTTSSVANGEPLDRTTSRYSVNNIKSVPNGGTAAWLQVLGSFFLFFNTWGLVNMFGSFQSFYETDLLSSWSPSDISWIGSIQAFLLMLGGALTGPIYDAGYVRSLLLTGSFLVVFGQMMLSLATEYYQVMLAQGIAAGLGFGCLFIPGVAILSTYFNSRLATATGLAATGSSIGGVVYPIVYARLLPRIGFPWTVRVMAFLSLLGLIISNVCLRVRVLPAARRKFVDLAAWREAPYALYTIGSCLGTTGLYVLFFYVQSFAIASRITDETLAFYLLAILNAGSFFGRIVPNVLADRFGPLNMVIPCAFSAGILTLCLIATHTAGGLMVIVALYGFFSGTFVSLPATIYVQLTANRALIGTRMGMGFSVVAMGLLVGAPISGAILKASGFTPTWIFGGVLTLAGASIMVLARVAKAGWKPLTKV